jgi:hypothetical protein
MGLCKGRAMGLFKPPAKSAKALAIGKSLDLGFLLNFNASSSAVFI